MLGSYINYLIYLIIIFLKNCTIYFLDDNKKISEIISDRISDISFYGLADNVQEMK